VSLGTGNAAYMEKTENSFATHNNKNKYYKANLQQQKTLTCSLFVIEVQFPILVKKKCLNHLFIEVNSLEQVLSHTQHS
jgi:hypothetical protein